MTVKLNTTVAELGPAQPQLVCVYFVVRDGVVVIVVIVGVVVVVGL